MNPQNIIVMGGSFNPPTIAHLKSMQKALARYASRKKRRVTVLREPPSF
ncbi:MAG: hypothetical protein IJJ60_12255 [Clostridia bacterium]|nr:hypothetical protein [Clostridia bacterium]